MPSNECIPFYDDGDELTVHAAVALTGKRFAKITGRQSGYRAGTGGVANLDTSGVGGNYVGDIPTGGTDKTYGVVQYDVAAGEKVTLLRRKILPVTAGATVTVGSEVEVDSAGRVINLASGKAVGLCLVGATIGLDAEIAVY
jgi:hypothetical protein